MYYCDAKCSFYSLRNIIQKLFEYADLLLNNHF